MISPQLQNALTIFINEVAFFYSKHDVRLLFTIKTLEGKINIKYGN